MAAGTAIIDMLSVNVKSTTANLTGVSFLNAASAPYNLFTSGLTLAYQPAPIVVGGGNDNQVGNHNDNNNNQDINKVNPPIKHHDDAKPAPAAPQPVAPKPVAPKVSGDQTQHQSTGAEKGRSGE
jgi:hypothetical protein